MKKYYLNGLIAGCLALLVGCQSFTNTRLFSPSDEAITSAVRSAFNNKDLSAVPIHVETQNGTVILKGYVKTIRQSDTAGDVAGKVAGVRTVQNELIVRK